MIFLSSLILKKNIGSMYIWYLIGLPISSIMLSTKKYELFSEELKFLGQTVLDNGLGLV